MNFSIDSAFKQNKCDAELLVVHIPFDIFMVLVKCREKPITLPFALLSGQIKHVFPSRSEHGGRRKREYFTRPWRCCELTSKNVTEILTVESG